MFYQNKKFIFQLSLIFVWLCYLLLPQTVFALTPGALIYRTTSEGKMFGYTTDKLLEASGFRMGPYKLMDLIGNDINYAVSCSVYEQMNHPERLKPSYIQEKKVKEGKLGKKSGEGYYTY